MQSITCDTGYDDISFRPAHLPASSHRPYCFPPRFPPNRVARRVDSRHDAIRHATRLLVHLGSSHRLIRSARCLLRSDPCCGSSSHPSHRRISRPAPLPVLLPAERPASPCSISSVYLPARCLSISFISSAHRPHFIPTLYPMRQTASRRNGARDGAIDDGARRNDTTSDTA